MIHGLLIIASQGIRLAAGLVLTLLVIGPDSSSAEFYGTNKSVSSNGIEVLVEPIFNHSPHAGFLPVQIKIRNSTDSSHSWQLSAVITEYFSPESVPTYYSKQMSVGTRTEKLFEVFIPLPLTTINSQKRHWGSRSRDITLEVTGYGIDSISLRENTNLNPHGQTVLPFIGLSSALYLRSWPVLSKSFEKSKSTLVGAELDLAKAPADWRAYAGLGAILLTTSEWQQLGSGPRTAILDWISMGGRLQLFQHQELAEISPLYFNEFPLLSDDKLERFGLGTVKLFYWDGKEIPGTHTDHLVALKQIETELPFLSSIELVYTRDSWPFLKRMPRLTIPGAFLFVLVMFLVSYFIIVGPINIKIIAGRRNRLALFISTPVIALIFSVLLAVALALREGFGGWGLRATGVYLLPDRQRAIVTQEQTSRTALVFQTGFTLDEDIHITPIRLAENAGQNNPRYRIAGRNYYGDWFSNRSLQSQLITYVEPTRASLKLVGTNIRSNINSELSQAIFIDSQGRHWHAENISPGNKVTPSPISLEVYDQLYQSHILPLLGPKLRVAVEKVGQKPGSFIALTTQSSEFVRETLPTLRWQESPVIFFGSLDQNKSSEGAYEL